MESKLIIPLTILFAASFIASLLNYWVLICRVLYQRGAKLPTGLLPWRVFRELKVYKEIRGTQAQSLAPYFAMFILIWFNVFLLIVLLIRALWEKTQPIV